MRRVLNLTASCVVGLALSGATTAWAQTVTSKSAPEQPSDSPVAAAAAAPARGAITPAPPPPPPQNDQSTVSLPIDLARVKQEAEKQPAVKLDGQQLKFYVLVLGKESKFNFNDFIGDYDLKNGPTKGGAAMTHQEFMSMVTPKELNELLGSTSSSSFAMFQAAIMNAAGQAVIKKGIELIRHARDEHEIQTIREQIDRELAALLGKRP